MSEENKQRLKDKTKDKRLKLKNKNKIFLSFFLYIVYNGRKSLKFW